MRRLVIGIVLVIGSVIVAATLGCSGGLGEGEVEKIVDGRVAAIQVDYRAEIRRGDEASVQAGVESV